MDSADAGRGRVEERAQAIQPALVEALSALAATGTLQTLAHHLAPLSLVRDQSLAGTSEQIFQGTPLAGMLDNLRHGGKGGLLKTEGT